MDNLEVRPLFDLVGIRDRWIAEVVPILCPGMIGDDFYDGKNDPFQHNSTLFDYSSIEFAAESCRSMD